ncbi:MAG: cytochrome C oxidase subunit IV family protein [Elusimicrobia bacterium]|nr:cytochrome C oxidase subunit IV family protein [Elusimicrobiota bacterium]
MNQPINETESEDGISLAVYVALLALTAATLAAGMLGRNGRLMAISIAVIIASLKASLIGFYYMGLRRERALTWVILGAGVLAVMILLVGIFPDLTFRRL